MPRNAYWEDTVINLGVPDNGDTLQSLVGGLSEDERCGMTIARTIVDLQMSPQTTSGVVGSMICDVAIGLANQQAFSTGAAALPDLAINSERPPRGWVFRTRCAVLDDATTVAPLTFCIGDFRGKRKVDAGILYLHLAADSRTGTAFPLQVTGIIRLLYLMA